MEIIASSGKCRSTKVGFSSASLVCHDFVLAIINKQKVVQTVIKLMHVYTKS